MRISAVVAIAQNGTIGKSGDLPWSYPDDLAFFKHTTKGHAVIMGRKNYESIPARFRPLPQRRNYVITRQKSYDGNGAFVYHSVEEALDKSKTAGEQVAYVVGGAEIFRYALSHKLLDQIFITWIHRSYEGDVKFPSINFSNWDSKTLQVHRADERHEAPFSIMQYDLK